MRILAGSAAAGVVLLVMAAIFLLRRKKKKASPEVTSATALPAAEGAGDKAALHDPSAPSLESKLAEREALQEKMDAQALNALKIAPVITKTAEVLAKHLREKVSKEAEISAQILRTWIREDEG